MKREDNRLIGGEKRIEVLVGQAVWMFALRLKRHQDNDVDVVTTPQTVIGDRQQRVGIGRKIDADDLSPLVYDVINKPRVLVAETVMVLSPHVRCKQVVERSNRTTPGYVARCL